MATLTLRPNAAGSETSITFATGVPHYAQVNEAVADNATTTVYTDSSIYERDLYHLPAPSGSGAITKITVHFRCMTKLKTYGEAKASIKSDSIVTDGSAKAFAVDNAWEDFTQVWNINPADSAAWEWADIDALQIGVSLKGSEGWETYCTQVYVVVDYINPSYTTDLVDIDLCESGGKTWAEPTATGWTYGAAPSLDTENFIQGGASAMSKAFNATGVGGMMVNNGGAISLPTDGAILGWFYWASPKTLNTDAEGGIRLIAGSSLANFLSWDVGGKTTYVYGGWINYAVNTTLPADDTVGTGLGNSQYVGGAFWNLDAITKGNPCLVDAFRYGRCEARMSGGEGPANYATFVGFAAANDAPAARWGLIQAIAGGYLVKGLIIFGYASAVNFIDSNRSLIIQNTNKVTANFNAFEVRNVDSLVDLTSVSILSLSTVSRGRWITTDNATVNLRSCTFTDMGVLGFASKSALLNSTFRRCDIITQNGATFTGCTIDSGIGAKALVVDDVSKITNTTFKSKGTGYALEGFGNAGNYNLVGLTFTDYAAGNGTSGNEAIHVLDSNPAHTVNLYRSGGGTSPSIHTEGATVNVISARTFSVTVKNEALEPVTDFEWRIYEEDPTPGVLGAELAGEESSPDDNFSYPYSYTEDVNIVIQIMHEDYEEAIVYDTLKDENKSITIILRQEVNI